MGELRLTRRAALIGTGGLLAATVAAAAHTDTRWAEFSAWMGKVHPNGARVVENARAKGLDLADFHSVAVDDERRYSAETPVMTFRAEKPWRWAHVSPRGVMWEAL